MKQWKVLGVLAAATVAANVLLRLTGVSEAGAETNKAARVVDMDNPDRQSVTLQFLREAQPAADFICGAGAETYTVPAGKRLVLDYIYANGLERAGGQLMLRLVRVPDAPKPSPPVSNSYLFPLSKGGPAVGPRGTNLEHFTLSEMVRIYFEAEETFKVCANRLPPSDNLSVRPTLSVHITGHLLDIVPPQ